MAGADSTLARFTSPFCCSRHRDDGSEICVEVKTTSRFLDYRLVRGVRTQSECWGFQDVIAGETGGVATPGGEQRSMKKQLVAEVDMLSGGGGKEERETGI